MQADRSHYGVNDGNSGLFSLSYSDSLERMVGFPSALGEDIITAQSSCRVADDYWSTQSGKHTLTDFSIGSSYHQITSIHDVHKSGSPIGKYPALENQERLHSSSPFPVITSNPSIVNSSAFERTNYSFDGSLPFVGRAEVVPVGNSSLNEWILRGEDVNSSNPGLGAGPSRFSRELSLSLATSQPSGVHGASINQEQCSEMSSSPKRRVGSDNTSCSSNSLSYSYKQTLQVSPVLSGSRFFHAMQEILAEVACYALENLDQMSFSASGIYHDASFSSRISSLNVLHSNRRSMFPNKRDVESKKKHLLSLLQLVDDQYNQCLDEIHTVISAFHAVTEMDPNLHARFALPTISLMYRSLRERISSCILAMGEKFSGGDARDDCSFETSFIKKQWAIQQLSKSDHQLWRPQRGLPERSVSVLKAWMFQNFLHPYPKDAEKHLLAMKSGLTRSQVSNWFINARVRLWKPMIEEMYAEMSRRKTQRNEVTNGNLRNQMRFDNIRFTMD